MNIFILDLDPKEAARFHCDKHVVKMILEAGQMLSTAHWILWLQQLNKQRSDFRLVRDMKVFLNDTIPDDKKPLWQLTHINHPCSIWTRESISNYNWHLRLMRALLDQYTRRYNKKHAAEKIYKWLNKNEPPNILNGPITEYPICMPDDCKVSLDPVVCYRKYYKDHKSHFAKWKNTKSPEWWK